MEDLKFPPSLKSVMIPKNLIKPLELVVSAIHCLREEKGSSPQTILRYLISKYNIHTEILKPQVQAGLKKGVSFGLITQDCGLYRLNDILSPPFRHSELGSGDGLKVKPKKKNKRTRKIRVKTLQRRIKRRPLARRCHRLQRCRRKPKKARSKKRGIKHALLGEGIRRNQIKFRRQTRQKNTYEAHKLIKPEIIETEPAKVEHTPSRRPTVSTKEQEREKLIIA